jgi:hypothetical protein
MTGQDETRRLVAHVRYAAQAVEECLRALQDAVRRARRGDVCWEEIADALGIPHEEAVRRFAPLLSDQAD